jgi:hypothetical protein
MHILLALTVCDCRCAVLFCDALSRHVVLPCRSADEFVSVPPTVGGW